MEEILAVSVGYVVGSVPFAYLIAQRRGVDLRRAGSGNVGAANVLRTSGMPSGLAAMCLDVAKGAVVVVVVQRLCSGSVTPVLAGLSAVIGHVYPVWLGFRGGKGVATAAGVFMMLAPVAVAMAATVFVMVTWVAASNVSPAVTVGSAVAGVIIVVRHRDNIGRLRAGTERRVGERLR
jgi:glycerol-3-phosphate acyltransferase PlsY